MPWLAFGMMTRELRDGEIIVGSATDAGWRVTTGDLMPRHFSLVAQRARSPFAPARRTTWSP
jgi:hypothetical protein